MECLCSSFYSNQILPKMQFHEKKFDLFDTIQAWESICQPKESWLQVAIPIQLVIAKCLKSLTWPRTTWNAINFMIYWPFDGDQSVGSFQIPRSFAEDKMNMDLGLIARLWEIKINISWCQRGEHLLLELFWMKLLFGLWVSNFETCIFETTIFNY